MLNICLGLIVYIASALLLAFISIEECLILLFTTGILGLVMGVSFVFHCLCLGVECDG